MENSMTIFHLYKSYYWHSPCRSLEQCTLSAALSGLYCLVHPFLQLQWWNVRDATDIVLWRNSQTVLALIHPKLLHRSGGLNRLVFSLFNNKLCCLSSSLRGCNFLCKQAFPTGYVFHLYDHEAVRRIAQIFL